MFRNFIEIKVRIRMFKNGKTKKITLEHPKKKISFTG